MNYLIKEREDGSALIALSGEIDLEYSADVRKMLLEAVTKYAAITVDMREVSLIDSSGVASLVEAYQNARRRGKEFALSRVADKVFRVLRLARLETVFSFVELDADGNVTRTLTGDELLGSDGIG